MSVPRPVSQENPNQIDRPNTYLREFALQTFPFKHALGQVNLIKLDENGDDPSLKIKQVLRYDVGKGVCVNDSIDTKETPNYIEINLSEGCFDHLQKSLLPAFIGEGYKVDGAYLAATTFHAKDDGGYGAGGGDFLDTGVVMSRWSIWIKIGNHCTIEQKHQLENWFQKVKEHTI